ncbi:MAG: hypothetical protein A3I81_07705, partial [Deltaproteobacteria bacterium RIFCSPLOWO2_02_FULL_55_12]
HLCQMPGNNFSGWYAVFSFYILSGYLMTFVLNENYGFHWDGLRRYFTNRTLRIYPTLWAVILFSLPFVAYLPISDFHRNIYLPTSAYDWLRNLTLIDLRIPNPRLIPPTWSLFVEVVFYIAIGLIFARKKWITFLWFFASVAFTAYLVYSGADKEYRYFSIPASSVAFSSGAILYYLRKIQIPGWFTPAIIAAHALNLLYWHLVPEGRFLEGFYLNVVLSAALIFSLSKLRPTAIDKVAGDLAYPVFLCHWIIAALINYYFEINKGATLFIISIPPVLLFSFILHAQVEKKTNAIRDRVKNQTFQPAQSQSSSYPNRLPDLPA